MPAQLIKYIRTHTPKPPNAMKYRPKHIVEYALLRGLIFILCLLPLRAALGLGWVLAAMARLPARKKIREARRRMREVFGPDVPEKQIRTWAWIAWRNFFFNVIETARAPHLSERTITRLVDNREISKLFDLHREVGGYVLAVCHMGNWDLAGFCGRILGLPIFVILRDQSNPLTTRYLERIRNHFDFGWVERHRVLGSVVKKIRAGEIFTILPDVRAKTKETAVHVPFLGGTAHIMGGTALFARLTEKPIGIAIVTRRGWAHHHWEIQEPVYPDMNADREEDILRMTREVMARFDAAIRKHPEQYFWYNKRWILDSSY
jgi:KDO2-lipid IV(A) lauroyltransferase